MAQQFSVSMCVYGKDNPKWVQDAVDSILNQTASPSEIVMVVDGPIPASLDQIVTGYEQRKDFRVIRLPENLGHGNARRIGLANCSYELVALMDADDISVPNRFETQLRKFQENPEISIVGGNIIEFVDTPDHVVGARMVVTGDADIRADMKKRCPMNQVTVMFRKREVEQAGGYADWFCNEDYYLWLRMLQKGAVFANVPEYLVHVRVGSDMYRRRGGWTYFCSEARLQNYMLSKKIIGPLIYAENILKRFIVQILLPNCLRSWVFQKFARKQVR